MKMKMLAKAALLSLLVASVANADPATNDNMNNSMNMNDNTSNAEQAPMQFADNGAGTMSGAAAPTPAAPAMSGSSSTPPDLSNTPSGNMSGTPGNNMSGTPSNNMSGTASPSDEGGADTATGDDY